MEDYKTVIGGGKTEISLDEATNEISVKGVNVLTTQPAIGDIVCYDESRKIRFIVCDTFHAGTFPVAWETVGVVVLRKGNQVTICSKHNEAKKFMEVYPYVVSGYVLDGSEHTVQLRLHGKPTTSTYYEFKYTASTDSEFVSQLKQFLTTNGETDWSAYLMEGKVILQYDNYTESERLSTNITQASGLTLKEKFKIDFPETQPAFFRCCGTIGRGVWNVFQAKKTFEKDINNVAYNPSNDVNSVPSYPVCWPAFAGTSEYQEDHCLWLRQQYCKDPAHPTIEEWERYIDDIMHRIPYMLAGHAPKWRDGAMLSANFKGITYQATNGARKPLYPAVKYCSEFMGGVGYLPSMLELIEAFGNMEGELDPVNVSLRVIGGNVISFTTRWTSARNGEDTVWAAVSLGCPDSSSVFNNNNSVPFARIELPVE